MAGLVGRYRPSALSAVVAGVSLRLGVGLGVGLFAGRRGCLKQCPDVGLVNPQERPSR